MTTPLATPRNRAAPTSCRRCGSTEHVRSTKKQCPKHPLFSQCGVPRTSALAIAPRTTAKKQPRGEAASGDARPSKRACTGDSGATAKKQPRGEAASGDARPSKRACTGDSAFAPLSAVQPKQWQYQMHVGVQEYSAFDEKFETVASSEEGEIVYRDLVISANASIFDFTKAVLCAFGLNSSPFQHTNGTGKLDVESVQIVEDGAEEPIVGLGKASLTKDGSVHTRTIVTKTEMKRVKLAQLLDRPRFDTSTRKTTDGDRSAVRMMVHVPQRTAFISPRLGGVAKVAEQCLVSFNVRCVAVGTKKDMQSKQQTLLPRATGGRGEVYGGNTINWEGDEGMGVGVRLGRMAIDSLNETFVNGRVCRETTLICSAGPEGDGAIERHICKQLRTPLFGVYAAEAGAPGAALDEDGEYARVDRPKDLGFPREECAVM